MNKNINVFINLCVNQYGNRNDNNHIEYKNINFKIEMKVIEYKWIRNHNC